MAHVAYAEITKRDATSVRAAGRIELLDGSLVAAGDGAFYPLSKDVLDQSAFNGYLSAMRQAVGTRLDQIVHGGDRDGYS